MNPAIELLLRQAGRGVAQINARGSARQQALAPFAARAGATYGAAAGAQQQLGGALSQSLAGAGQQLGGQISGALQGIQAPGQAVAQYGGGQAAMGAASGAAMGALSTADLERLRSQGTAEQIYAAALPRLAALAADQERRGFLADAQQRLYDLSLETAQRQQEDAIENARYEREFAYKKQQDRIDRKRADREFRYEARQDRLNRRRQTQLDRLAQAAAMQEYGLDLAKEGRYAGQAAETARHHRATEAASAASRAETQRHHRQTEKNAAKGGSSGDRAKYFDSVREDASRRAQSYAKQKGAVLKRNRIDRGTARARLWAEYGTLLLDRGFDRKQVSQMIERILTGAGY